MATINQLISEIAHSLQQADSIPVRRAIKLAIIHARNEIINKYYNNTHISDKYLQQRFRIELIDVPDGDINITNNLIPNIKRSKNKIPRPTRISHNIPFHSVRTSGANNTLNIPFIKENVYKYYKHIPYFCPNISYDLINEYLYIFKLNDIIIPNINFVIIESIFEKPELVNIETKEGIETIDDDYEYLLPEDMINPIKKLVLETFNVNIIRETNEIPNINLTK